MIVQRVCRLLLVVTVLAGCASDPQIKDTTTLAPGQGVMVARLAIPYLGQSGHLKTTISVSNLFDSSDQGTSIELHNAETFLVVPLPAGNYQWKDFRAGSYSVHWAGAPMHFAVVAGKINYVGDITVVMQLATSGRTRTPNPSPRYEIAFRVYDNHRIFLHEWRRLTRNGGIAIRWS